MEIFLVYVACHLCSLKRKIACKIHDEHSLVKNATPANDVIAKMASKDAPSSRRSGEPSAPPVVVTVGHSYPSVPGESVTATRGTSVNLIF